MTGIYLILWACLWPITWGLVEYIDDKRLTMIGEKAEAENDRFDWFMFTIWIAGFALILFNS
jgi:hypothetical protein